MVIAGVLPLVGVASENGLAPKRSFLTSMGGLPENGTLPNTSLSPAAAALLACGLLLDLGGEGAWLVRGGRGREGLLTVF